MKKTILLLALCAGLSTMHAETAKKKKTKPAAAANTIQPLQIPAGAVKTDDGYRVVDEKGVAWIYRETPFGVTRAKESTVVEQRPTGDPDAAVTATREGDVIHFQRPGPFGITKWDKNANEMTAGEQKIWQRIEQTQRTQ